MILKGIRVLDFTQYLAGPTVTRLMVEMGAEVIKVERAPAGDPSRLLPAMKDGRSAYFVQQNLGKHSLCIDLNHDATDEVIKDLVSKVDVVVENYGPGVMDKRGWDFESLKRVNPKLVMASISAFGRDSPLSHKTGFDWIAQAFAGFMHMTGPADGPPHPVGVGIADVSAGVHAFASIGYALFNRERTGEGQWMDISMIDCIFAMHEINLQVPQVNPDFVPKRVGAHHPLICPCGVYKSPDGYVAVLVVQGQWKNMCKAMERPDLETDPRFAEGLARAKHQAELIPVIEDWMGSFDSDTALLERLDAHRVPCGPVLSPMDALTHPYFKGRGAIRPVSDPILGNLMLPGFPLRFSGQSDYSAKVAPLLGQHNAQILAGVAGYDAARIADLGERGLLMSGDR
ncbi:MAG: CoA transferase [Proteobacteria bacterium]|nr:CoA transferase [Pseudomonadota bacterium]MBK8957444.1 CoA transferase [Pseudomonadota bacterium]